MVYFLTDIYQCWPMMCDACIFWQIIHFSRTFSISVVYIFLVKYIWPYNCFPIITSPVIYYHNLYRIAWHTWSDFPMQMKYLSIPVHTQPHCSRKRTRGPFHEWFFHRNSNSIEHWIWCNSIIGYHIVGKFCLCHDNEAVVPCTKFYSDHIATA